MRKLLVGILALTSVSAFAQSNYKRADPISEIKRVDCVPNAVIEFSGQEFNHNAVLSSMKLCTQLKSAMKKDGFTPKLAKFSNKDGVYEIQYSINNEDYLITDKKAKKRARKAELVNL